MRTLEQHLCFSIAAALSVLKLTVYFKKHFRFPKTATERFWCEAKQKEI